jgi:hypothetical protein
MMLSQDKQTPDSPSCYFTYTALPSDHWSTETPLASPFSAPFTADPHNPLLAKRQVPTPVVTPVPMDASRLLQLQTAAAHGQIEYRSTSSRSSSTSSGSASFTRSTAQCSRCQTDRGTMVQYSINSYYCSRCANIVGYGG